MVVPFAAEVVGAVLLLVVPVVEGSPFAEVEAVGVEVVVLGRTAVVEVVGAVTLASLSGAQASGPCRTWGTELLTTRTGGGSASRICT